MCIRDSLKPAASASLVVAQKAPDKWVDFHHALLAYFRSQFQASNGTVVQNLDASWKQVKVIATEVGVPSDVIDTFPVNAVDDYLKASTTAWQDVDKRQVVAGIDHLGLNDEALAGGIGGHV